MVTPVEFKSGMRYLASAVTIIATECDGARAGMTATAVSSLTADPPMLLVCVNKNATSHEPICRSGRFSINVLSADDLAVAQRFATGDMTSRFQVGRWAALRSGGLTLESALVTFDCMLKQSIPIETHSIFIGQVAEVIVRPERSPLAYVDGQYAGVNAFSLKDAMAS